MEFSSGPDVLTAKIIIISATLPHAKSVICGGTGNDFWHLTSFSFHSSKHFSWSGCSALKLPITVAHYNLDFFELHSDPRTSNSIKRVESGCKIWQLHWNFKYFFEITVKNWRNVSFSILVTIPIQTEDQGHRCHDQVGIINDALAPVFIRIQFCWSTFSLHYSRFVCFCYRSWY